MERESHDQRASRIAPSVGQSILMESTQVPLPAVESGLSGSAADRGVYGESGDENEGGEL